MLRRNRVQLFPLLVLLWSIVQAYAADPFGFGDAKWIWTGEAKPGKKPPAGSRFFRTTFELPDDYQREGAEAIISADNLFILYLNGRMAAENLPLADSWKRPLRIDVRALLQPGINSIAIEAANTIPGPAAVVARLVVFLGADQTQEIKTDGSWRCSNKRVANWITPGFADSAWPGAYVVAPFGKKPWGTVEPTPHAVPIPGFEEAIWIWTPGTEGKPDHAVATRTFRCTFEVQAGAISATRRAKLLMTADNLFSAFVNGKHVVSSDTDGGAWKRPEWVDISDSLRTGRNVLAVQAGNILEGAAGLLGVIVLPNPDGSYTRSVTDGTWKCHHDKPKGWNAVRFDDSGWLAPEILGTYGVSPWKTIPLARDLAPTQEKSYPRILSYGDPLLKPGAVFVRGYLPFRSHHRENFVVNIKGTRAYTEQDSPTPAAIGRQLVVLIPLSPDGEPRVVCDAHGGVLGSPSVSIDGQTIYFAMAPANVPFFHLYRVNVDGTGLEQITNGPCHDFDPVELPNGRIAFSSTRMGNAEEYHGTPACAIFSCEPRGTDIQLITPHIVFDREPEVTAGGSLVFLRSDNFLERAKVEVHVHETHLDGTAGQVLIGPGRTAFTYDPLKAAESPGNWLRRHGAGSPTPLPDGRVLALTQKGVVTSELATGKPVPGGYLPFDMSAMRDGRVLCTDINRARFCILTPDSGEVKEILKIAELDLPEMGEEDLVRGLRPNEVHSVQPLGARLRPASRPSLIGGHGENGSFGTGFLYCQNALKTQHTAVGTDRIKAIRVYEGRPFSIVPTKSIYVHIGTVGVELGTVPIAPDGSFLVEVPADRPLSIQAVDAEGRPVINEMSWIYVRPGERRSCVGCHAPVSTAPAPVAGYADRTPPLKLLGQGRPHRFRANNAANGGIFNLQLDRFREAANIGLFPVPRIADSRQADVHHLTEALLSDDPGLRISAVQKLGILRPAEASASLLPLLDDPVPEVRNASALALATCAGWPEIDALASALDDRHPVVARAAHVALEHLTGRTPAFDPFTGDRAGETRKWRSALEGLSLEKAEAELIAKLASESSNDVRVAVKALGRIGGNSARHALRRMLADAAPRPLRTRMAIMRSLGALRDEAAVPGLTRIINENIVQKRQGKGHELGQQQAPVYLTATAAEALGMIGTEAAEQALLEAAEMLVDFSIYTFNCGDHTWLMGSHSSIVHYRFLEAFDRMRTRLPKNLVAAFVRSIPIDKDRGLLYRLDGYEILTSRVIRQSGHADSVVSTCLAVLTDREASGNRPFTAAVSESPYAQGHIRKHSPEARAAQVLSVICWNEKHIPSIIARLEAYFAREASETRSWVCFMLLRTLGQLARPEAAAICRRILAEESKEAEFGRRMPPNHWAFEAMKPFFRSAAAHALGKIGDADSADLLMRVATDYDNAPAVRRQAAVALGHVAGPEQIQSIRLLARDYPDITIQRRLFAAVQQAMERQQHNPER